MAGGGSAVVLASAARLEQVRRVARLLDDAPEGPARLVRLATRVTGATFGFLTLVDDQVETLAAVTAPPDRPLPASLPVHASVCQHVVRTGLPLVSHDLAADEVLSRLVEVRELGLHSYAGVPIRAADGSVLGGLCLAHDAPRTWSPQDLRVLLDLAEAVSAELQLRGALEDARAARAEEERRAAQLAALHQVASAVARGAEPDEVLELVAAQLHGLDGVEAALVVRTGPDGRRSLCAGAGRVPGDALEAVTPVVDRAERSGAAASARVDRLDAHAVPVRLQDRHWGAVVVLCVPAQEDVLPRLQPLGDLIGLVIGNTDAQERLTSLARTDPLTGALNRRGFDERLAAELERDRRYGGALVLCLLDVDRFKDVNDAHGHATGDAVLRALVERVRLGLRGGDVVGRPGGDEFALLLPSTEREAGERVLGRVLTQVRAHPLAGQSVSVSLGAVALRRGGTPAEDLLASADAALYAAKAQGRGRLRLVELQAEQEGGR